jgi:hypothetical protein
MNNQIIVEKKRLKGGSLSGTYYCLDKAGRRFIRKEVSLVEHREYGFQRWYSQLKKLQRFDVQFSGLFPQVLGFGQDDDKAYFDMEFIEGAMTAHEFLMSSPPESEIHSMFNALISAMDRIHKVKFNSSSSALDLYIHEEMERRIFDCMGNDKFKTLIDKKLVTINGEEVMGIFHVLNNFQKTMNHAAIELTECFTHGNITLENILYDPIRRRITFIDPYEENIVDNRLAEYSQILQSSNSHYELYNLSEPIISRSIVEANIIIPRSIAYFNKLFFEYIRSNCTEREITLIKLFEVSQYVRMLPFKMQLDERKMILFYSLASLLYARLDRCDES